MNKNILDIEAKYISFIAGGQGQVANTPVRLRMHFIAGCGSLLKR